MGLERVRGSDHQMHTDEDSAWHSAGLYFVHRFYSHRLAHDHGDVFRGKRRAVHQHRNGGGKDLIRGISDHPGNNKGQNRIDVNHSSANEHKADKNRQADEDVAQRMLRVGDKKAAIQRFSAAAFVAPDKDIDHEGHDHDANRQGSDLNFRRRPAEQTVRGSGRDFKGGHEKKAGNAESRHSLEFVMSIGMSFIGSRSGQPDYEQADKIVQRIGGGVHGIADHTQGSGPNSRYEIARYDGQIQQQGQIQALEDLHAIGILLDCALPWFFQLGPPASRN